METIIISSLLIYFIFIPPTLIKGDRYNVIDYGANHRGKSDSSMAFLRAWEAACNVDSTWVVVPPTIYVPRGRYLIGSALVFSGSNCTPMDNNIGMVLRIEGTLVAPDDYMVLGNVGAWISFEEVSGFTVSGGVVDGKGGGLWACKYDEDSNCPSGATTLSFTKSKDITISGLRSVNSQLYHIVINECDNVLLRDITVLAPGSSPNTDGIHVQQSNHVLISNSNIGTGDDCISVGVGTTDLSIDNVVCGPGHGISIGSLGKYVDEPGVESVTVTGVIFKGTQNGVRIKSWGRASHGYVRNVLFRNITMDEVQNPIIIDQNYCPNNFNCPGKESGVEVSDVIYEEIRGSSATEVAVKFDCSPKYPCSRIRMKNVQLTYKGQIATASCANAVGTVDGIIEPIISCIIRGAVNEFQWPCSKYSLGALN